WKVPPFKLKFEAAVPLRVKSTPVVPNGPVALLRSAGSVKAADCADPVDKALALSVRVVPASIVLGLGDRNNCTSPLPAVGGTVDEGRDVFRPKEAFANMMRPVGSGVWVFGVRAVSVPVPLALVFSIVQSGVKNGETAPRLLVN